MNWISKTRRPNMASRHSTTPAKKATVGPIYRQHRRDYRRTVDEPSKPVTSCTIFPYHKRFILSKHQQESSKTFPHTSALRSIWRCTYIFTDVDFIRAMRTFSWYLINAVSTWQPIPTLQLQDDEVLRNPTMFSLQTYVYM